jgi:hypothetical protein
MLPPTEAPAELPAAPATGALPPVALLVPPWLELPRLPSRRLPGPSSLPAKCHRRLSQLTGGQTPEQ